ncbi:MAG TPA: hypothetical protein VEB60_01150 [Candidatus Paceibacterota bacterium]|nr:hypothetical protein [Candidatus Paceibacterota bacterium]
MPTSASKTQDFIPIQEIRDDVVIMKDGSMRMVVIVSSINFALKSPDEQMAIIIEFQNFLNSLDFSIQIAIQSRRLDIRDYIMSLDERLKEENNELIQIQIREYIDFIKNFNDSTNIMTKSFFITVPYVPPLYNKKQGILGSLLPGKKKGGELLNDFAESKTQLEQRVNVVIQGLSRVGVRSIVLGTEELVELYFKLFNPGENSTPSLEGIQANQIA